MKGNNIFGDSNKYYAIYSNIDGLESSSPVRINGLTVGNVTEIYFHPNNSGDIIVEFTLNDDIRFPINSVAKIYNLGKPPRRLVMLHLDGHAVVMPPSGTPVMNGDVQVGFLGTVARHHELGPIALAVVKRNTPVDAQLMVEGVSASQQIIVEA